VERQRGVCGGETERAVLREAGECRQAVTVRQGEVGGAAE